MRYYRRPAADAAGLRTNFLAMKMNYTGTPTEAEIKVAQQVCDKVIGHMLTHYRKSKPVQALVTISENPRSTFQGVNLGELLAPHQPELSSSIYDVRLALLAHGVNKKSYFIAEILDALINIRSSWVVGLWHARLAGLIRHCELEYPVELVQVRKRLHLSMSYVSPLRTARKKKLLHENPPANL